MPTTPSLPSAAIQELVQIVGEKWVLTNPGDLYLYSFDSGLDRAMPSAVVLPGTTEQISLIVGILSKRKIPFVARGAATSLCGGPVPFKNGVVIGLARLTRVGRFDKDRKEITVEPGLVNLKLQQVVAPEGLFYPPDPGSQKACTIGGNVATNAGGPHCLKYGVTSNFVMGLDVVLPDGKYLQMKTDDPGFDLTGFFVGSEGTLGVTTRIRLKLLPLPADVRTMLVSFNSMEDAIQSVTDIIAAGVLPATLEAMDKTIVAAVEAFVHAGYPLTAEAVLLIEVDGDTDQELDAQVLKIQQVCEKNRMAEFRFAKDDAERVRLWEGRRGSYAAMARLAPNVLVEDGAVPRTKLPEALRAIKQIAADANLRVALLFHAGDGNLHPQIIFDERDAAHTRVVKEAGHKMLKACVDLGGTISGEHGIGVDKREAMKWLFTRETLTLFRRLKNVFDPENLCNPDKLIPLISKSTAAQTKEPDFAYQPSVEGIVTPANEEEMIALVKTLARRKTHFGIVGSRTKYRAAENLMVQTTSLNKVIDFDKGNLTLTVQGGATLEAVRQEVEKENLYLWMTGAGTVGGVIAARSSVRPALRDLILGMRILLPTGDVVQLGAKTMKNVAGYDAGKLMIGSWGMLGIILDVTMRLFPYPFKAGLAADPKPQAFALKEIHRKIKTAFDPDNILAGRASALTAQDLANQTANAQRQQTPQGDEEKIMKNMVDKFWT